MSKSHGAKIPTPTAYHAPVAYSAPAPYTAPAPYSAPAYTAPANPQTTIPLANSYQKTLNQASTIENELPAWMNQEFMSNPIDSSSPQFQQAEQNYYQSNVAPQIAQDQANLAANGQDSSSYAGALVAQDQAMGNLDKYNAGLNYEQQLFNNALSGEQAYFQGPVALSQAQNNAAINRGENVAQLQSQNANNQNNFNLNTANNAANYSLGASQLQSNYNLDSALQANNYNLTASQGLNNYNLGTYEGQLQGAQIQNNYSLGQQNAATNAFSAVYPMGIQ